jgi:hypothetical protein
MAFLTGTDSVRANPANAQLYMKSPDLVIFRSIDVHVTASSRLTGFRGQHCLESVTTSPDLLLETHNNKSILSHWWPDLDNSEATDEAPPHTIAGFRNIPGMPMRDPAITRQPRHYGRATLGPDRATIR